MDDFAWLRKLDKDGNISDSLTKGSSCDSFDVNGEHLVSCELQGTKLAELYLDGEQITHFNDFVGEEYSVVAPEAFSFTASDGYEIHGWVMKPRLSEAFPIRPSSISTEAPAPYSPTYSTTRCRCGPMPVTSYSTAIPEALTAAAPISETSTASTDHTNYQNLMDFTDEVAKGSPKSI